MATYRVEEIGEGNLQEQLNVIASDGWTLVTCTVHGLVTDDGRPLFVTIWVK